ncbi:MAG: alpha/beta fold hydrolase [Pseudomonadota bacterium]
MLNSITYGTGGPPLVIAHGLFGSARNWGVIAKRLAERRQVICVDMRNHAGSFWSDDMGYEAMAADLAEVIRPLGTVDLLGHSMGGKAAMVAALGGAPTRRLVVADIAPVPYTHTQMHFIDAMERLDLESLTTRAEADAALQKGGDGGFEFPRLLGVQPMPRAGDLGKPSGGEMAFDGMADILGFPDLDDAWDGEALFLSGALSDYVSPDARPAIKRHFPSARFAKIPGAGHWLHAEKPREFEAAITTFLESP